MNYLKAFCCNYYLVSSVTSWFIAQLIKFLTEIAVNKRVDFKKLATSGGMPSSHSSSACGLATAVAIVNGLDSALFAICFVFGIIVMYDATGVRRETGRQARILNKMVTDLMEKKPIYFQKELKELIGHTPFEVLMGGILGIVVAFILYPAFSSVIH